MLEMQLLWAVPDKNVQSKNEVLGTQEMRYM